MQPRLIIVHHEDWPAVRQEMNASPWTDMFYDDRSDSIYADQPAAIGMFDGVSKFVGLGRHECGHAWKVPKNEHKETRGGIALHAVSVGFDDRAASGWLRWFRYKPIDAKFEQWITGQREMFHSGALPVRRMADLKA